jgi:hypothetical protein
VDLTLEVPATMQVKEALADNRDTTTQTTGTVQGQKIIFHNLTAGAAHDVRLTLADGTILQGVDLSWYNQEPAKADAEPFNDEDREQIRAILQDVKGFTNRNDILKLTGDHNRAVLLAQLIRDRDFHADKGGEIIWRIELWYFKNNYGGWEKIGQVNKVLRRERYASAEEFKAATQNLRWTEQLGGIRPAKDGSTLVKFEK